MKRLKELRLEDCVDDQSLKLYKLERKNGESFGESIYRYLTENSIVKSERYSKIADVEKVKKAVIEKMEERESHKECIQFFTTTFNPKPRKTAITNGQVFPDMGEFLSILHLCIISQQINLHYPYKFQFILGYEGSFFRNAGKFDKQTTDEIYQVYLQYKEKAEELLKQKDLIVLFDVEKEIESFDREFYINIENEKFKFLNELSDEYLESTTQYYLNNVYDAGWFSNEQLAWDFCQYHALHGIAFNRAKFQGGKNNLGIMNNYPDAIRFCLKYAEEIKDEIHLELHPEFETYAYNCLTARNKEGKWLLLRWEEIEGKSYEPVYIEELEYPFYYQET